MMTPVRIAGPSHRNDPTVAGAPPEHPVAVDDDPPESAGCGWGLLLFLILLTALGLGGWWGVRTALARGWIHQLQRTYSDVALLPDPQFRPGRPNQQIQIYFVVRGRGLDYRSFRLRSAPASDAERVDLIRQALVDPDHRPDSPAQRRSPLPPGTTVRAAYLLDGIVWLDLSKEFQHPENPSPLAERLTVYALVNTFLLNVPGVQGVRILVDGQPVSTAWGWLDLSAPLGANLSLIG
jgi:hypothetical protein